MAQETEELFARAKAAVLEATLLTQINFDWQCRAHAILSRMKSRAVFRGPIKRLVYPQDVAEPQRPLYRPFPKEEEDDS